MTPIKRFAVGILCLAFTLGFMPALPPTYAVESVTEAWAGAPADVNSVDSIAPSYDETSASHNSFSETLVDLQIIGALESGKLAFLFFYTDWCHFARSRSRS